MNKKIDLRSDTVTLPTKEMMDAMMQAELGDDVYGEDSSTNKLESYAAELFGKEAGMLLPSGTMGNLAAILTHTRKIRPEIIAESGSHIIINEAGNYSHLGGVAARSVEGHYGAMDPKKVEDYIRDADNLHHPVTSLICIENTHNSSGGTVVSLQNIKEIKTIADKHKIPMHLDGARIFNAAKVLNVPVSEVSKYFDSVQFCLSKGLSAPIGSILVGNKDFIKEARHYRKMLGGGMRQCGIIAGAGMVALKTMTERLVEDHENAGELARGLSVIPGIYLDMKSVQTNMVKIDVKGMGIEASQFVALLKEKNILCGSQGKYIIRFVLHRHISRQDVSSALSIIEEIATTALSNSELK